MDIEKKKQILNNYRHLESEYNERRNNYKEARLKFTSIKAQICDDMPKGSQLTFDKIGEGLIKIQELEETCTKIINELIRIDMAIANLESSTHRRLITLRYINLMQWEAICMKMHYKWTQIHKIHSDALKLINL